MAYKSAYRPAYRNGYRLAYGVDAASGIAVPVGEQTYGAKTGSPPANYCSSPSGYLLTGALVDCGYSQTTTTEAKLLVKVGSILIPQSATTVVAAELDLTVGEVGSGGVTVAAKVVEGHNVTHDINTAWGGETLTTAQSSGVACASTGTKTFDVASVLQEWLDDTGGIPDDEDGIGNLTFVMLATDFSGTKRASFSRATPFPAAGDATLRLTLS